MNCKYLVILIAIVLFLPFNNYGQESRTLSNAAAYQNQNNSLYWKNRKPFAGYWQQDVSYDIKASIDEATDIIDGSLQLAYFNNSPDTLSFVFFHLYENAFQPGSYLDKLQKQNGEKPKYGKYESEGWGTRIEGMQSAGKELKTELDNTILKVYLDKPLMPNDRVLFDIKFKTYFDNGSTRRRMKKFDASGYKHYDGVHWYPRICVYDRKFGWETDQHLGREFYGDYGVFDAQLTFANNYIVEATGVLQNADVVIPDSLRKKLDIKNFADKKFGSKASEIIPKDGSKKTWIYHAENVHDFAWTADPTYRIGTAEWNGVKVVALAQESNASKWQNAADYTAKIIKTYSEDFGMYVWPKIVVADARDGMEYPMLTLDGGSEPGYRSLLAHEVGHQWFFGMVGNNETYRAALDEGFTQFLTSWSITKMDGEYGYKEKNKSWYVEKFSEPQKVRDGSVYGPYLRDAIHEDDMPLNTHSDQFNGALGHGGGYNHVYFKTATMLYNLQYVLGDELFQNAMKNYFSRWKMCHPYFDDFRSSIIDYTHTDLNWFFDQWMETTKNIDYRVGTIKALRANNEYEITFVRKGKMQMPIDFTVYSKNDSAYHFYIPNTWFQKKTSATILPKWTGWDRLQPTYAAKVYIPDGIEDVVIDPSNRLADVYMPDNAYRLPEKFSFDSKLYTPADWTKYELRARPDGWYNYFDGYKIGFNINGDYMRSFHIIDFSAWLNTGIGQMNTPYALKTKYEQISYRFSYSTSTDKILKNSTVNFSVKNLDGLQAFKFGMDRWDRSDKNKFYFSFKSMYRGRTVDTQYLLYKDQWQVGKYNNTVSTGVEHYYHYRKGSGAIKLGLRSTTIGSDYDYANLTASVVNKSALGKLDFNTRSFAQLGTGSNTADESALFLAGASPEELMDNKYTRSRGLVDNSWLGYGNTTNHFQAGGGLNLRGYAGYLGVQETKSGEFRTIYKGNSGVSESVELGFDRLFGLRPKFCRDYIKLQTYLFGDAGIINVNKPSETLEFSDLRADAGLGAAFTIKKFWKLQTVNPLTIRFDMPMFLNHTPDLDPDYVKFRWVIAVNRSF